jgi:hypothetical protein
LIARLFAIVQQDERGRSIKLNAFRLSQKKQIELSLWWRNSVFPIVIPQIPLREPSKNISLRTRVRSTSDRVIDEGLFRGFLFMSQAAPTT